MVRTGGTLSAKMIELIGDLNEKKTLDNVRSSLRSIEKQMRDRGDTVRVYAELFARVEDMQKDVSEIQRKIKSSSSINKIELGVELSDMSVKDINEQVQKVQDKFSGAKTANKLKLDVEFDFTGSASKIKEEMNGIREFMQRYGEQMKNMDIINLDDDARNVAKNAERMGESFGEITGDINQMSDRIETQLREMTNSSGKFSIDFKRDFEGAITGANASLTDADGTVRKFNMSLDDTSNELRQTSASTKVAGEQQERLEKAIAKTDQAQRQLNTAMKNAPEGLPRELAETAQESINVARAMEEQGKVTNEGMQALDRFSNELKELQQVSSTLQVSQKFKETEQATRDLVLEFERLGQLSSDDARQFEQQIDKMANGTVGDMEAIQNEVKDTARTYTEASNQVSEALQRMSRSQREGFVGAIQDQDIQAIQRYVGEIYDAEVASVRLTDQQDKLGRAVTRLKVDMQDQSGTAKTATIDMDRGYDKLETSIREVDVQTKSLRNSTSELDGGFKTILGRVTQYFGALEVVQTAMQGFRRTIQEIRDIDAQMTELARVADPSLNLDVMLERSVGLSKELGSSVNEVVGSVAEMSRTFGDFNEEQILAVSTTAILMDNVSELDLQRSTETLVGAIRAFNIEAEDSIHIVNAINEVDNTFAIQTDQIADAMGRAGATAQTFGIEMEELIGDVTAIGEVTQESGQRIGTALRTIYSRITTHKDSIEILEGLGIALHEMTEQGLQVRDVTDILGDLGGMWQDLSAAQQQSIGLAVAGRNRLTQFLALMNNYETSIKATTTAYNSQGSAMREQERYMDSYEYQLTVLGATATDLALTLEEKLVGDAMYLLITSATDVVEVIDIVIDKFGVLPTVMSVAGSAFMIFGGDMASSMRGGLLSIIESVILKVADLDNGLGKLATRALGLFDSPLTGLLTGGAIVAGLTAVGWAIEKVVGKMADARRANDEAERTMTNAIDAYNSHGQDITGLIDRYEELSEAMAKNSDAMDEEEVREYHDLVNQISTILPNAVSHIDAQGEAHLKNTDSIREEVGAMEELSKSYEVLVAQASEASFAGLAERMADAQERNKKATEEATEAQDRMNLTYEEFVEEMGPRIRTTSEEKREAMLEEAYATQDLSKISEDYYQSASDRIATEYEMNQIRQESALIIGDNTVAMLESEGSMENVSSQAQALIRDYANMNSSILESADGADEYNQALEDLEQRNEAFGSVVVQVYDNINESLGGVNTENAVAQMDALMKALPQEFYNEQAITVIKDDLLSLSDVIAQVASGAEIDVDAMVEAFIDAGLEADVARQTAINLGIEFENQSIKTAVAEEELAQYNDELVRTKDLAIETIDPLAQLFGINSEDLQAMDSHIQFLNILQQEYGNAWETMDAGKQSIGELADYFDMSSDWVIENIDQLGAVIRAMQGATIEVSEETGRYIWKFGDDVSDSTKQIINDMIEAGSTFGGMSDAFVEETGLVMKSQEELAEMTEELNERFKELSNSELEGTDWELFLGTLNEQLTELRGTFTLVEDDALGFKFVMADGTESEYLNNLNTQLEKYGMTLEVKADETGAMNVYMVNSYDQTARKIASVNDLAMEGAFAIDATKEALRGLVDANTSDEDRETYLTTMLNQLDMVGENIIQTRDENGKLKNELAFSDGTTNTWLDTINELIKELNLEIEITTDKSGDLKLALKTEGGDNIFTETKEQAEKAGEEVEDTHNKTRRLADDEYNVDVDYDDTDVQDGIPSTQEAVDKITQGENYVPLGMDSENFEVTAEEAERKIDTITEKERIAELKLNIDEEGFNRTVEKIGDARLELIDLESELEELERLLSVTDENMRKMMTNTQNITDARNAVRNLSEDVNKAIEDLGNLYAKFSSGGIDTSGFESATGRIIVSVEGTIDSINNMRIAIQNAGQIISAFGNNLDITGILNYRANMQSSSVAIQNSFNQLSTNVNENMISIRNSLGMGLADLLLMRNDTSDVLGQITRLHRLTGEMIVSQTQDTRIQVQNHFLNSIQLILDNADKFSRDMESYMKVTKILTVSQMESMGVQMITTMQETATGIVSIAQSLPRRIGQGIRDHMSNATSAMNSLASNMVSRFKKELGIHSPSRVFESLGGDVIDGLVNGLTGRELTSLGQSVFSDFSDGAISTIEEIKGYMTFSPTSASSFGSAFVKTSGFGPRRSPGGIGSTNHKGVDYAAPSGTPIPSQSSGRVVASGYSSSLGNYVVVESAGGVRHTYGHNSANNVRVGQTVGKGDVLGRVGSTGNSTGPHVHYQVTINGVPINPEKLFRGFAEGGFVEDKELAWHGEEGLEAIIPLMPHRRDRGLDLWAQSGEILGLNSNLIDLLVKTQRQTASFGGFSTFAGLDGEAGSGESDTATSGIIKPSMSSITKALGVGHEPMFSSQEGELEQLYRRDTSAVNIARREALLTLSNTELSALVENTLKYRNALQEVNYQENELLKLTRNQLNATIKRQGQIEKELSGLKNTSKHTEEQRKQYNALQQEFDRNTESIYSMENEIRQLQISMDERKVQIYTDYIGQLTAGFEELRNEISKTTSDLQFSLDYLSLTDENNIGGQIRIQYDVLKESLRLENTLMNNVNRLQSEYSRAVSRYGKDSEQALLVREQLWSAESDYQGSILDRINLEQEIESTRESVAQEGIDTLKNYYKQTQTMTERAIELERKSLEESHEHRMSLYDEEIAKINSVYDARLQEMDEERSEQEYQDTINELNSQRADLMSQISRASRDTSLEGRRRLAKLQSELATVNEELETTQTERQDELYRQAIERQREEQISALELEKERAEEEQEIRLASLDQQLLDAQQYAERMVNDEAMWQRLTEQFVTGNTTPLASMMEEMTSEMSRYMSGNFAGISMGYGDLSDEDKAVFAEDTLLEISNLMVGASESMERFVSTSNEYVRDIGYVAGRDYDVGQMTNWSGTTVSTQGKATPDIPNPPKPAPKPKQDNRYYTIKKGDTLWDLAQKYYGNPYKWTTIAQANQNPDPRRLQIGRKLLIPFRDGGFTGDWAGDEGRIALLHKKELVLNQDQTRDILDTARVVEGIANIIPRLKVDMPDLGLSASSGGPTYVVDNLNLNLPEGFKGSEKEVENIFDSLAKNLKKKGR